MDNILRHGNNNHHIGFLKKKFFFASLYIFKIAGKKGFWVSFVILSCCMFISVANSTDGTPNFQYCFLN